MFRPINIIHRIDRTIKQDDSDSRNQGKTRGNYNLNIKFEQDTTGITLSVSWNFAVIGRTLTEIYFLDSRLWGN